MKEEIKKTILDAITAIPKGHASGLVVRETIRCVLYGVLKERGLLPVPGFQNPRYPEGPVDMVGMAADGTVEVAFCANPTVELKNIKSLERVMCEKKYVISFSSHKQKVEMSTFFLKPGIEHIYVYE